MTKFLRNPDGTFFQWHEGQNCPITIDMIVDDELCVDSTFVEDHLVGQGFRQVSILEGPRDGTVRYVGINPEGQPETGVIDVYDGEWDDLWVQTMRELMLMDGVEEVDDGRDGSTLVHVMIYPAENSPEPRYIYGTYVYLDDLDINALWAEAQAQYPHMIPDYACGSCAAWSDGRFAHGSRHLYVYRDGEWREGAPQNVDDNWDNYYSELQD